MLVIMMSVIMTESVCIDCIWRDTCYALARIDNICSDKRKFKNEKIHKNDIREIIIRYCTIKNIDRSYK